MTSGRRWSRITFGFPFLCLFYPETLPPHAVLLWVLGSSCSLLLLLLLPLLQEGGFPGGSVGKGSTGNAGDSGRCKFNPWVRKIPWRRVWQPTPVFLPGESHGQRSLVGYSPWGHKVSDRTEATECALLEGEGNMSTENPLCVRPCAFFALNHLIFRTREMQVRSVPGA